MVMIGNKDISVSNARKILTSYNRHLKKEGFGTTGKGGKGVYKMTANELGNLLKEFKVIGGKKIKHKVKVPKWEYDISAIPKSRGQVKKSKPLPTPKPTPKPKPKPAPKNVKIKKPKPEPKPKPKKKKLVPPPYKPTKKDLLDRKQLVKSISQSFDLLEFIKGQKKLDAPEMFLNYSNFEDLLLGAVLKNNKNDCGVLLPYIISSYNGNDKVRSSNKQRAVLMNTGGKRSGANAKYGFDIPTGENAKKYQKEIADKIAEAIVRCKKRGKVVAVAYILQNHFNLLLFNYHRNEVERFEPHGGATGGRLGSKAGTKKVDGNMDKFVKSYLNPALEKLGQPKMKYLSLPQSCPKPVMGDDKWYGLQSLFAKAPKRQGTKIVGYLKGMKAVKIDVKDPEGWCVAWGAFYLDQRLKNLKASSSEVKKKLFDALSSGISAKKQRNVLRNLALLQGQELKNIKAFSSLPQLDRMLMMIYLDKTDNKSKIVDKILKVLEDAYGKKEFMKIYTEFNKRVVVYLKKYGLSDSGNYILNIQNLWFAMIQDHLVKVLGIKTN